MKVVCIVKLVHIHILIISNHYVCNLENIVNEFCHFIINLYLVNFKTYFNCVGNFSSVLDENTCTTDDCPARENAPVDSESQDYLFASFEMPLLSYDAVSVLVITAVTILTFLLGYIYIDKSRKEAPLIAKINKLEKALLISMKENELLSEKASSSSNIEVIPHEIVENLKYELEVANNARAVLEEQIQGLEKELENSTEVGLELNRMLSDILSSQNGSDTLIANVESLQRQLIEQQSTINTVNESLNIKDTENHELHLELDISNKKVTELQTELDKMVLNLLKIEEEKDQQQTSLEAEVASLKQQLERVLENSKTETIHLTTEIQLLQNKLLEAQRNLELKINELNLLKDTINEVKSIKSNSDTINSLLDSTAVKAELLTLKRENQLLTGRLQQEQENKSLYEKQVEGALQEAQRLKEKYDEADRQKLEAQTKLQVLASYFKEKEAQLQK